jgi:glycosyltransferase involved in cell wall biosynthesis
MSADNRAPVSVCLICRNESPHVEDCLKSVRPFVREICVLDTGSVDNSPEIAKRYADKFEVFTDCNDAEGRIADFSLARNRSFALATQPWAMWIDADDVLVGGENLAKICADNDHFPRACVMWNYDYDHDGAGNVTMKFIRERLVKPARDFKWISPVHETLVPQQPEVQKILVPDGIKNVHRRRDVNKVVESGRNLRILQTHYNKVGESDVRSLYYLGLELGWTGNPRMAIDMHTRYVELSGWDDEKCLALLEIARHHQAFGEYDEAIAAALKAVRVRSSWGEPFFSLAKSYYFVAQKTGNAEDWRRAYDFAKRYIESPPAQTVLFINPMERAVEVHRFLVVAAMQIGDVNTAEASCRELLKTLPEDPNTIFNLKVCRQRVVKQAMQMATAELLEVGGLTPDGARIVNAALDGKFKARPVTDKDRQAAEDPSRVRAVIPRDSGLDIVLFTGPGAERWTPETIRETGIGGSEKMAWEMARRLVKLGNRVRLYGDTGAPPAVFEGVEWLDHTAYRNITCDVLITSRRPVAVDDEFNVRARTTLCWVHDVHCGSELTLQRALRIDRFLCLSEWHCGFFKNHYEFVHPSQVVQTRNGIDLSLYEKPAEARNPHRMIYSSSLDRGAFVAIDVMPEIRKRVPDAELHIYYGMEVWKRYASPQQLQQIAALEALLKEREKDGVVYHGRVKPEVLAEEQKAAGVWSYSTWFSETSCLSAMEAQAAGLRVVTSPIAALNETVGPRGAMISGDWLSPGYRSAFIDACVDAMTRPEGGDREELQRYARDHFSLDTLARDWVELLHRTLAEVQASPIVPYSTPYKRAA